MYYRYMEWLVPRIVVVFSRLQNAIMVAYVKSIVVSALLFRLKIACFCFVFVFLPPLAPSSVSFMYQYHSGSLFILSMNAFIFYHGKYHLKLEQNTEAHPNGQCMDWTGYVVCSYGRIHLKMGKK